MEFDQMTCQRKVATRRHQGPARVRQTDRPVAEMARWLEQVRSLPDIRWEKVLAVRTALADGDYALDGRLADMADHLPDELAILARPAL